MGRLLLLLLLLLMLLVLLVLLVLWLRLLMLLVQGLARHHIRRMMQPRRGICWIVVDVLVSEHIWVLESIELRHVVLVILVSIDFHMCRHEAASGLCCG